MTKLTPAERLARKRAELDALLEQNDAETRAAQRALARDAGNAEALRQIGDLAAERAKLEAMRAALDGAADQCAAEDVAADRRARVERLQATVEEALAKRDEAARAFFAAIEQIGASAARYDAAHGELVGAVSALFRLTGRDPWATSPPDTAASRTEGRLLDELYASGLGRRGPRLFGRVTVERGFGDRAPEPLETALEADGARLRAAVAELARAALRGSSENSANREVA